MAQTQLQKHLRELEACEEACEWAGTKTASEAWNQCENADWLLWWTERINTNSKSDIVKCAVKIARTVAHLNTDTRVMAAIEAAEKWAADPSDDNALAANASARAAMAAVEAAASAAGWAAMAAARAPRADAVALELMTWALKWAASWAAQAAMLADQKTDYCALIRECLKQPWMEPETGEGEGEGEGESK